MMTVTLGNCARAGGISTLISIQLKEEMFEVSLHYRQFSHSSCLTLERHLMIQQKTLHSSLTPTWKSRRGFPSYEEGEFSRWHKHRSQALL